MRFYKRFYSIFYKRSFCLRGTLSGVRAYVSQVRASTSAYIGISSLSVYAILLSGCAFLDFNKSARLSGYQQTRQHLFATSTTTTSSAKSQKTSKQAKDSAQVAQEAQSEQNLGLQNLDSIPQNSTFQSEDFATTLASPESMLFENEILSKLYQQQKSWEKTPYRSGGIKREGADCSGFVMVVFDESFSLKLPRITLNQMAQGEKIGGRHTPTKNLQPADLLFFRTGRGAHGYHVGIYLQNGDFMHLSTKGGAKIVNISNKYWKNRLRKVVRYEIP